MQLKVDIKVNNESGKSDKIKFIHLMAPMAMWLALRNAGQKVAVQIPLKSCGIFGPDRLQPRVGIATGPSGKAGSIQPSFVPSTDVSLRMLLELLDQHRSRHSSRAWLTARIAMTASMV